MEVMMIGRKRRRAASMAASRRLCPCSQSSLANSTMRIAFFAERPMMVIRPTLKYTSLDIPLTITASTAPMAPIGTISITDSGIDQLVERHQQQEHHQDGEGEQAGGRPAETFS